jgi:hypothetical protein
VQEPQARAVRWTCDIQDLLAAAAEAERHLQALPDGFKAERMPLVDANSLCVAPPPRSRSLLPIARSRQRTQSRRDWHRRP